MATLNRRGLSRIRPFNSSRSNTAPLVLSGLLLGAAGVYLMERSGGRRRRALVRDKLIHSASSIGDSLSAAGRSLGDRLYGVVSESRAALLGEQPEDQRLIERVRASMGRVLSHPHAVSVGSHNGVITLSGPILSREVRRLVRRVRGVRGVRDVISNLEAHERPGDIPALQGEGRRAARSGPQRWSPAARAWSVMGGAALMLLGIRQRSLRGAVAASVGAGLILRAVSNQQLRLLLGLRRFPYAIDINRSITVKASPEELYRFLSQAENLPRIFGYLEEVRALNEQRTLWRTRRVDGAALEWETETTRREPGKLLAWRSTPGSLLHHSGTAHFEAVPGGNTRLHLMVSFHPPKGELEQQMRRLLGRNPKRTLDDDLRRLKGVIEARRRGAPGAEELRQ